MLVKKHILHCVVIVILYFCQGLVQGTLSITPLMLLQRHPELSAADQGTLGLPVYAFSLKFLWAPIVDRYFIRCSGTRRHAGFLHRRIQWVCGLQLVMAAVFVAVASHGDDVLDAVVRSRTRFWQLWGVLVVLALSSATQDVAVDAWAVEGLPAANAPSAGSLQLVGVVAGMLMCYSFVQLNSSFPAMLTLSRFTFGCGIICVVGTAVGTVLALTRPLSVEEKLKESEAGVNGVWSTARKVMQTRGVRELLLMFFSRGWPLALGSLVQSRLLSLGMITAATVSRYRSYSTLVQLLVAPFVAPVVLDRHPAAAVYQAVSGWELALMVGMVLCFLLIAAPSAAAWYGTWFLCPFIVVCAVLGSVVFVANTALTSVVARRFTLDVGGVLTLLNALSNLGMSLPASLCMYLADAVVHLSTAATGTDTSYARAGLSPVAGATTTPPSLDSPQSVPWRVKADVAVCAAVFFTVAALLRWRYLIPSARFLCHCRTPSEISLLDEHP